VKRFLARFADQVLGVLNGFDRLVLRGVLYPVAVVAGMRHFLHSQKVLLMDFAPYVYEASETVKAASAAAAVAAGRPLPYLTSPKTDKAALAQKIAQKDGITEGLIAVLRSVELCKSPTVRGNRATQKKELVFEPRKCLHYYHYLIDPVFGFMNARIQTWFPFNIQVCLNGREALARALDREGIRYERRENCFAWIEDLARAQELMDQLLRTSWPDELGRFARLVNPAHAAIFGSYRAEYYWIGHETEWASDVMFRDPADLAALTAPLARHGVATFQSDDVLRFLGRKPSGHVRTEVTSQLKRRPEGVRVRHSVGRNSLKLYDKQGAVLRVETTINDPRDFKVFRPKEGAPDGEPSWQKMRKGVADLHRRAEVSQAANDRYLDSLASLDTSTPVGELARDLCRPKRWKGQPVRALRPWSEDDHALCAAVLRGEFAINGFRNRDLQPLLYDGPPSSPQEQRRRRGAVTRRLRLLRAHGLIQKVSHTHRYVLTPKGRDTLIPIMATQNLTIQELKRAAA
jgi:hypothetical protein